MAFFLHIRIAKRLCVLLASLLCLCLTWLHMNNPLRWYGVRIDGYNSPEAATSSCPFFHVWCSYNGRKIDAPIELGGIPNPDLRFEDVDKDGIQDIILENTHIYGGGVRQVLSFKPAKMNNPPYFKVLENNVGG